MESAYSYNRYLYENKIAENIFDWWISGKAYEKWYAEKYLQGKFDFSANE